MDSYGVGLLQIPYCQVYPSHLVGPGFAISKAQLYSNRWKWPQQLLRKQRVKWKRHGKGIDSLLCFYGVVKS